MCIGSGYYQEVREVCSVWSVRVYEHPSVGVKNGRICHHYKVSLSALFDDLFPSAQQALIVEEDLDVSPDFFAYFDQTMPLLADPTVYVRHAFCASSRHRRHRNVPHPTGPRGAQLLHLCLERHWLQSHCRRSHAAASRGNHAGTRLGVEAAGTSRATDAAAAAAAASAATERAAQRRHRTDPLPPLLPRRGHHHHDTDSCTRANWRRNGPPHRWAGMLLLLSLRMLPLRMQCVSCAMVARSWPLLLPLLRTLRR